MSVDNEQYQFQRLGNIQVFGGQWLELEEHYFSYDEPGRVRDEEGVFLDDMYYFDNNAVINGGYHLVVKDGRVIAHCRAIPKRAAPLAYEYLEFSDEKIEHVWIIGGIAVDVDYQNRKIQVYYLQ
jgi:hypothetical protein